ncbi:MAG TPA: hypothetical protein VJ691_17000 [Vicinamibacterales bacterium]|nr:hypothetical protein [Vicinamibacterales bacterium]
MRVTKSGFHTATISNPAAPQLQIRLVPVELFNLRAAYSITFEAAGCDAIPAGLRTRTYSLAVAPPHTASPAFTGALQDAAFYRGYDTLFIMIGATARVMVYSWAAFEAWLEDQPIFEQLTPSGYLALSGTAHVVPDGGGTLSGAFNGSFTYCTSSALHSTRSDWPPICTGSVVACESANHRLTLVPR